MNYFLDDDIISRLVFRYYVTGKDGKKKPKYITDEDDILPHADRMRGRYTLMVRYQGKTKKCDGDAITKDVSCNSEYMADVMPKVGKVRDLPYFMNCC